MPRGLAVLLIAAAGVVAYANTLANPFIFDDEFAIVRNQSIRDPGDLGAVFSPPVESPTAGRPLANLSFALNYAAGGDAVRGYHVVNIAFHVVCGWLLFGIVRRTFGTDLFAFSIALLWTVHPLNSEAVTYVTERTESMMACAFFLALYASIRASGAGRASPAPTAPIVGAGLAPPGPWIAGAGLAPPAIWT